MNKSFILLIGTVILILISKHNNSFDHDADCLYDYSHSSLFKYPHIIYRMISTRLKKLNPNPAPECSALTKNITDTDQFNVEG